MDKGPRLLGLKHQQQHQEMSSQANGSCGKALKVGPFGTLLE